MRTVEQSESSLEAILREVAKGETVEILRQDIPVAVVYPVSKHPLASERTTNAIERLRKIQERNTLGGISIKTLIEEGRP